MIGAFDTQTVSAYYIRSSILMSLIHIKSLDVYTFVVKTDEAAAICWEAECVAVNLWRKARKIQSLSWQTAFDLEDVEVLQTRHVSPMNLFLQDLIFRSLLNVSGHV